MKSVFAPFDINHNGTSDQVLRVDEEPIEEVREET
jgi:hypothetical protein